MVAENIHALHHGLSLEILKEGGSEAKLELPKTWGERGGGGVSSQKTSHTEGMDTCIS